MPYECDTTRKSVFGEYQSNWRWRRRVIMRLTVYD
jgi:hypothetical protein